MGVATTGLPSPEQHAVVWDANHVFTDLNSLLGDPPLSAAVDVNDSGQIAGTAFRPNFTSFAFRITNGIMPELPGFAGLAAHIATAINDNGDVVGIASGVVNGVSVTRAFLYTDQRGLEAIEDLIPPDPNRSLLTPTDINDQGWITGTWQIADPKFFRRRSFRIRPAGPADVTPPQVTNCQVTPDELGSGGGQVQISANVTDTGSDLVGAGGSTVDSVFARIDLPGGSFTKVELDLITGSLYQGPFVAPANTTGADQVYAITILASDFVGNDVEVECEPLVVAAGEPGNTPPLIEECPLDETVPADSPAGAAVLLSALVLEDADGDKLTATREVDGVVEETEIVSFGKGSGFVDFLFNYSPGEHTVTLRVSDGLDEDVCEVLVTVLGSSECGGELLVGTNRLTLTGSTGRNLPIRNVSEDTDLSVILQEPTGPFALEAKETEFVLGPGESRTIHVVFTGVTTAGTGKGKAGTGKQTGQLVIESSDCKQPTFIVDLVWQPSGGGKGGGKEPPKGDGGGKKPGKGKGGKGKGTLGGFPLPDPRGGARTPGEPPQGPGLGGKKNDSRPGKKGKGGSLKGLLGKK